MGVAYSAHTIVVESEWRWSISQLRLIFDHRRQYYTRSFCCGAVRPWSWRDWACTSREFSRVFAATLFAPRRDAYSCKVLGRRQRGKGLEVPCLYTCPRSAAVDRSRYRAIFFDQKRMRLTSSTKDVKKGCAYDPGALMIQGALQKQTLRYITWTRACAYAIIKTTSISCLLFSYYSYSFICLLFSKIIPI